MPWQNRIALIVGRVVSDLTTALAGTGLRVNSGLRLPGTEGLYDEASWLATHIRNAGTLTGHIGGVDVHYAGSPGEEHLGMSAGLRLRTHDIEIHAWLQVLDTQTGQDAYDDSAMGTFGGLIAGAFRGDEQLGGYCQDSEPAAVVLVDRVRVAGQGCIHSVSRLRCRERLVLVP